MWAVVDLFIFFVHQCFVLGLRDVYQRFLSYGAAVYKWCRRQVATRELKLLVWKRSLVVTFGSTFALLANWVAAGPQPPVHVAIAVTASFAAVVLVATLGLFASEFTSSLFDCTCYPISPATSPVYLCVALVLQKTPSSSKPPSPTRPNCRPQGAWHTSATATLQIATPTSTAPGVV